MKAIRYFVGILLFCGMCFGLEAAERPGKAIRGVCLPFGHQRDTWFDE